MSYKADTVAFSGLLQWEDVEKLIEDVKIPARNGITSIPKRTTRRVKWTPERQPDF